MDILTLSDQVEEVDRAMVLVRRHVMAALDNDLAAREIDVLTKRFGLGAGPPQTLEEVGAPYGCTRERIRQIEAKALRRLRHPARNVHLRSARAFFELRKVPGELLLITAVLGGWDVVNIREARRPGGTY